MPYKINKVTVLLLAAAVLLSGCSGGLPGGNGLPTTAPTFVIPPMPLAPVFITAPAMQPHGTPGGSTPAAALPAIEKPALKTPLAPTINPPSVNTPSAPGTAPAVGVGGPLTPAAGTPAAALPAIAKPGEAGTPAALMPAIEKPGSLPEVCRPAGASTFSAPDGSYCFAFPAGYTVDELSPGRPEVTGPPHGKGPEPLAARLMVEATTPPAGNQLKGLVDAFLVEAAVPGTPAIVRQSFRLGGEPAERLEVVPGREGARVILALHAGKLYHLWFTPSTRDFPATSGEVENLFNLVTRTFTFIK